MQSFMNDTAQYYFTVIYVLALFFQIFSVYKAEVLNKKEARYIQDSNSVINELQSAPDVEDERRYIA